MLIWSEVKVRVVPQVDGLRTSLILAFAIDKYFADGKKWIAIPSRPFFCCCCNIGMQVGNNSFS